MKKILIFSIAYQPFIGGAEQAVKEITDRVGDIQFDMITLRFDKNLPKYEKLGNVNVYRIGFSADDPKMSDLVRFPLMMNKYLFTITAFLKANSLNKRNNYDAIWSIMANYAGFAALFFKIFHNKTPFLLTLQEGDPFEYIKKRTGLLFGLYKKIFAKADRIQTISNYLKDYARSIGFGGPVDVIPNGVDIKNFSRIFPESELENIRMKLGKREGDIFLVHTGRLVLKNGIDDIISSLTYLPENVKFLSIGIGPDQSKLKQLAEEKNLVQRVIFLDFQTHEELPKYLRIADIFVRPSLSEGLGNSFLEAMAAGLPVIATPVGGIIDFLYDPEKNPDKGPTGLFCNVRDPKSIAEKVNLLVCDSELKEKIKLNANALVRTKYDWAGISRDMEKILTTIKPD